MTDPKREKILEAAVGLFKRFDLKRTTIDEMAKEAGIGKGTVYNYFTSKEEIFLAVHRQSIQEQMRKLRSVVRKESSPTQQLIRFVQARTSSHVEMLKKQPLTAEFMLESHTQPEYQIVR